MAVARKLSVLLHSLWVSGELYDPLHNARRGRGGLGEGGKEEKREEEEVSLVKWRGP